MDSGILSTQLETLPASGLTLNLKAPLIFGCPELGKGLGKGLKGGVSTSLSLVYLLFFLLLLTAVSLLPLLWWQLVCIGALLIWYAQRLFRRHFLLNHPYSIKKLVFTELGWCYVQLNNSQIFKADIEPDTILSEYLVILNLTEHYLTRPGQNSFISVLKKIKLFRQYSIFLSADRLGSNKFREIKRHLRFISFAKNAQTNKG